MIEYYTVEDMQGEHVFKLSDISWVGPVTKAADIVCFMISINGNIWSMKEEITISSVLSMMKRREGLVATLLDEKRHCAAAGRGVGGD